MAKPILIRGARQLLTLRGAPAARRGAALRNLEIILDGALLIKDGLILEANTSRRVEALAIARQAEEIDAHGCVVLPGFVDSHTHLVGGIRRSGDVWDPLSDAQAFSKAVQTTSQRTLESRALRLLGEFARHGTTMLEAKSGYGISEAGEIKILRAQAALARRTAMVASTFMGTVCPPDMPFDDYIDWMCTHMLPRIKRRGLASFADIVCERDMFSVEQARRYLRVARGLGLATKMHAEQTSHIGGVSAAVELGATSVAHLNQLTCPEIKQLASSETLAVLLPGPVFHTDNGAYPPARELIDAGAAVALGTDYNAHTCPSPNMQMMLVLACHKMGMTPEEAISAATINGAHAMRRAHNVGSLEHGKSADIIMLGVPDYREITCGFAVNLVEMTMKKGRVVSHKSRIEWPAA